MKKTGLASYQNLFIFVLLSGFLIDETAYSQCSVAPNISYSGVSSNYTSETPFTPLIPYNSGSNPETITVTVGSGLTQPINVTLDTTGNVYLIENGNNSIKKIALDGTITSTDYGFFEPFDLVLDGIGNMFVSDSGHNVVKKIASDGTVTTIVSGFQRPRGIVLDHDGNVYVCDPYNLMIKKISPEGTMSIINHLFDWGPAGIDIDSAGDLYVTEFNYIRKVTPWGSITTLGSGYFYLTQGIAVDGNHNVYMTDVSHVKKIAPDGTITTLMGDVTGINNVYYPVGIYLDGLGNLYVCDSGNNLLKKITMAYRIVPDLPAGMAFDTSTGIISGSPTVTTPTTTYTISTQNSCGANSTTVSFSTSSTLSNEIPEIFKDLSIFPNPFNESFSVQTSFYGKAILYDVLGKVILSQNLENGLNRFDSSKYPFGNFILQILDSDGHSKTYKMIKK